MTTVKVGENESLDSAIRRFKRKCGRMHKKFKKELTSHTDHAKMVIHNA